MDILISVSTVLFVILCLFIIIIILLQTDKSAGMGILGGSSQSAFGSSTADVITKITTVMVTLFMLGSLGLAVMSSWKEKAVEKGILDETKPAGMIEKAEGPKAKEEKGADNPKADNPKKEEKKQ